jgi:cytoskeletal protein CcmA (bactofilin family)
MMDKEPLRRVPPSRPEESAGDVRITGSSTAAGGAYRRVKVVGEGTFDGPVVCDELRVTGTVRVRGNLTARRMRITGEAVIEGTLRADEMFVRGLVIAHGNLEAEVCELRGGAEVDDLVNAERLDIRLYGPVRAREIGGSQIRIREGWRWGRRPETFVEADVIEGDDVRVEKARCRLVRGRQVRIGRYSQVERAEYNARIEVSDKAEVKEVAQL